VAPACDDFPLQDVAVLGEQLQITIRTSPPHISFQDEQIDRVGLLTAEDSKLGPTDYEFSGAV
jgi:hypothetical protein